MKKMILTTLASLSIIGAGSCAFKAYSTSNGNFPTSEKTPSASIQSLNESSSLTSNPGDEVVNDLLDTLASKGGNLILDGIKSYGASVVLNLLKECGFDFRDATTKTLEQIQQQLGVIESKIDALAKQENQHYSESILGKVMDKITTGQKDYAFTYVVGGLGYLASLENDKSKTEKEIEEARKTYYNNTISKLTIDGKPFASFVRDMADSVLTPNKADLSKDIFYYYDETLGVYNKWSTLKIQNTRNFMANIIETLATCANLAKFQIYYLTLGKDEATIKAYENMINEMVTYVNAVNLKFKDKIESLKPLVDKKEKGINIYLPTNKEYSLRMATLTFDINDKKDNDSRCALYMDFFTNKDGSSGDNQKEVLQFIPDQSFIKNVANDYKAFAGAFGNTNYTIKDYLKSAGFYAKNEDLFNKSLGLYNANGYSDSHGFMDEDYDITSTYYNDKGDYTRKLIYKIDSYHDWLQRITRTVLHNCDENYYLCFATPKDDKEILDGEYSRLYIGDGKFTLNDALPNRKYYYDCTKTNKEHNWYLHDCW